MLRRLLVLAALAALLAARRPRTGDHRHHHRHRHRPDRRRPARRDRHRAQHRTGWTKEVVTTDTGRYTVPFLPVGEYEIAFSLSGFQTYVAKGISLHVNDRLTVQRDAQRRRPWRRRSR